MYEASAVGVRNSSVRSGDANKDVVAVDLHGVDRN